MARAFEKPAARPEYQCSVVPLASARRGKLRSGSLESHWPARERGLEPGIVSPGAVPSAGGFGALLLRPSSWQASPLAGVLEGRGLSVAMRKNWSRKTRSAVAEGLPAFFLGFSCAIALG